MIATQNSLFLRRPHCARRALVTFLLLPWVLLVSACDPVTLTLFGVGSATGVSYTLNGYAYKTFTAPLKRVDRAAVTALKRMGIKVESSEKTDQGKIIRAKAAGRDIEIVLEALSPKSTSMRSVARHNAVLQDHATATEIVLQTEEVLVGA